jgi:hypothetical protein
MVIGVSKMLSVGALLSSPGSKQRDHVGSTDGSLYALVEIWASPFVLEAGMPCSSFSTDADLQGSKRGFAPKNKSGFGTISFEVTRLSEIGREGLGCLYGSLAPKNLKPPQASSIWV